MVAVENVPLIFTLPVYEPGARKVVSTLMVIVTDPPMAMLLVGAVALSQFPPLVVVDEMPNVVAALPGLVRMEVVVTTPTPGPFDNVTVEGFAARLSTPVTVSGRDVVALRGGLLLSLTVKKTGNVPTVAGVPDIMPPLLNVNPGGTPDWVQVYGAVPPVAESDVLYAKPTVPDGNCAVVIVSGEVATPEPTVILSNPIPLVAPLKLTEYAVPVKVTPTELQQLYGSTPSQKAPLATDSVLSTLPFLS
jgi:hypothetical protein